MFRPALCWLWLADVSGQAIPVPTILDGTDRSGVVAIGEAGSFGPRRKQMITRSRKANLDRDGNTSTASTPLALDEAITEERIGPGDKLILSGFGAGLTWGTALWRW